MRTKHTPGPWKININANFQIYDCEMDEMICELSDLKEYKANAQLIAAAPEIYHLLQKINTAFYTRSTKKEWTDLMELTKPLLQKARGEI
jgi:hypothetical protein